MLSPAEFGLYAALGLLAALAGVGFTRVLYGMEDLADRLWHWPETWRPTAGGLLLGVLLLGLPEMYGVGYPVLERGIQQHYVAWFLLVLLVGKIAATSLTIAIGGSGGVFAPSLFMGAMLGTAYGAGVHHLFPGASAPDVVGVGVLPNCHAALKSRRGEGTESGSAVEIQRPERVCAGTRHYCNPCAHGIRIAALLQPVRVWACDSASPAVRAVTVSGPLALPPPLPPVIPLEHPHAPPVAQDWAPAAPPCKPIL